MVSGEEELLDEEEELGVEVGSEGVRELGGVAYVDVPPDVIGFGRFATAEQKDSIT